MTRFDVVLVRFPFADLRTNKKRPCLVLTRFKPKKLRGHSILAMMTSNPAGLAFPGDVVLEDWQHVPLPKPTLVRLAKVVTIEDSIIDKKLGVISASDAQQVLQSLQKLFKFS